eukprot:TRINITY_DN7885_c0_g2_i5.p1 TRINITY_DN7885_c0_g2~~TRINITY_DN7885_c0_g2_i5.p1  ORF type:complete len:243 (-),score=34.44 TRINITY_DN7885_c0_g2_i5:306-1034(-)
MGEEASSPPSLDPPIHQHYLQGQQQQRLIISNTHLDNLITAMCHKELHRIDVCPHHQHTSVNNNIGPRPKTSPPPRYQLHQGTINNHVLLALSSNNDVFTPDSTVCESYTSPGDHQQAVVFPPQHLLPQPIFNNTTTRQGVNMPYTTRGLDWDDHNDSEENNNNMAHTENNSLPIENGDAVFTTTPSNGAVSTSLLSSPRLALHHPTGSSLLAHITTDVANQQQKQRHRDSLSMTFGSSSAL